MYTLNLETVQVLWFYNEAAFEAAGILEEARALAETEKNQPTWSQFMELVRQAHRRRLHPRRDRGRLPFVLGAPLRLAGAHVPRPVHPRRGRTGPRPTRRLELPPRHRRRLGLRPDRPLQRRRHQDHLQHPAPDDRPARRHPAGQRRRSSPPSTPTSRISPTRPSPTAGSAPPTPTRSSSPRRPPSASTSPPCSATSSATSPAWPRAATSRPAAPPKAKPTPAPIQDASCRDLHHRLLQQPDDGRPGGRSPRPAPSRSTSASSRSRRRTRPRTTSKSTS